MRRALAIPILLVLGLGCCDGPTLAGPKTVEFVLPQGVSSYFFSIRAHQSVTGEISGHIVSRSAPDYSSPFEIEGSVTCLRVMGNRASIGGVVLRHSNEVLPDAPQYHGWFYYVEDNSGRRVPDRHSEYIWVTDTPTQDCPSPDSGSATVDFTVGDVVISTNK